MDNSLKTYELRGDLLVIARALVAERDALVQQVEVVRARAIAEIEMLNSAGTARISAKWSELFVSLGLKNVRLEDVSLDAQYIELGVAYLKHTPTNVKNLIDFEALKAAQVPPSKHH